MCHLVLLMPIFGLALFLVLPWPIAVPAYLVVLIVSAVLYYKMMQAMKLPIQVGRETLLGKVVEVVTVVEAPSLARYLVRNGGELWSATSTGEFKRGDNAVVMGFEGSRVVLEPLSGDRGSPPTTQAKCH
ncbi:MAG: NfeD family protein [Dehalococcoidia bacterium]|nr:NfeD family protein [Dehalococcoidia bacterium]